MKHFGIALVTLFSIAQFATAGDKEGGSEKTYLIKVTDRAESVTYELMSGSDWQQLQKQLKVESSLHPKILSAAETQWRSEEDTKRKTFPRAAITLRKAVVLKEFTDASKASDALTNLEVREAEKSKAEQDKAAKREKDQIEKKTRTPDQIADKKRKEDEREAFFNSARNLYESKLQDLMAQAENKAQEGAAQPAADGKAPEKAK